MILGPLAILLAWITFALLFMATDKTGQTTFSGIGASRKRTYAVYSAGVFLSGIFLFLFFKLWFVDELGLSNIFLYIAGLTSLVLQPITAFVPFKNERAKDLHNSAIYLACALLPVMAIFIATSVVLPRFAQITCWALILLMLYLIYEFKKQFLKPRFMLVQAAYIGSFHLIILIATFSALLK